MMGKDEGDNPFEPVPSTSGKTKLPKAEPIIVDAVNRVDGIATIKAPPFNDSDPELWFRQVEFQFELNKYRSERTKFVHVASIQLPFEETSGCVWPLITSSDMNLANGPTTFELASSEGECESMVEDVQHPKYNIDKCIPYLSFIPQSKFGRELSMKKILYTFIVGTKHSSMQISPENVKILYINYRKIYHFLLMAIYITI